MRKRFADHPNQQAAQIAAAHRLPSPEQDRLQILLEKNREESLTDNEVDELDKQLAKLDSALEKTAEALLELAGKRKKTRSSSSLATLPGQNGHLQ